jgi:hypothetical protein
VRSFHFVRQRAAELARTGQHIDCLTIEMTLEREGFSDAFEALRDSEFRAQLKAQCSAHRGDASPGGSAISDGAPSEAGPAFDGARFPFSFSDESGSTDGA